MQKNSNRKMWTDAELVQVLALYCQLPFGKMHSRNPIVVHFAETLNRTPSSIALKLVNFASFDPDLKARGIRGMSNASKLDQTIWDRYFGRWEELSTMNAAEQVVSEHWAGRLTRVKRTVFARLGQGFFRNAVLSAYEGKCCLTEISEPSLLRASHIIPWSISEPRRLDPSNGICLNALHDAAFDSGLIGFDAELRMKLSEAAREAMPQKIFSSYFLCYNGKKIRHPERFSPHVECLKYHLENVFIS
jgi:putative restriction endonuclease